MPQPNRYRTYFDEAWKKVIERFFPPFLLFFAPKLYRDVDFSKRFAFLDKELGQLSKKSLKGAKFVDKLVKVYLKDGSEQWLLVHIEVQGEAEADFSLRMFRYFYRIFDQYGTPVVSIAVVTGSGSWIPVPKYQLKVYDSGVEFQYLMSRLMAYEREKLEADQNPMAVVVLAAQERERLRRRPRQRYDVKWSLIRKLYERKYSRQEILDLFEFIDWVLQLSGPEEERLREEIKKYEEVNKMPYITSIERLGREEGWQQGALEEGRELVLEALAERFGNVPAVISQTLHRIQDRNRLRALHRQAIRSASLEEFQHGLNDRGGASAGRN